MSVLTKKNFRTFYAREGVTQAEKGAHETFDSILAAKVAELTTNSIIHAELDEKSGLHRRHATSAVEEDREIPKGVY